MKLTKMSLVAALLVGSSAFAVDNIKVSGDAQVFYSTSDAQGQTTNVIKGNTGNGTLFDKDSSAADAALHLGITADLAKNDLVTVSTGAKMSIISTLGLENNFVSNVWGTSHSATTGTNANYADTPFGGAKVENANWFNEAYVAVAAGKSILKVGRQELDTPLAFTEKWSIESNSFEAAVLINQDIPDTTIVAAYVGNGNGTEGFGQNVNGPVAANSLAVAGYVNQDGKFTTYGENGAYALAVVNNSFKPLTVQAWYYDVSKLAQAYWLQADLDATDLGVAGLMVGAQYNGLTLEANSHTVQTVAPGLTSDITTSAYAAMLGYEMKDVATVKVSYSSVDKDHSAGFNTATSAGTAQSKLYTEAWWNYGFVTQADTKTMNLTIESPVNGLFDLGVYFTNADQGNNNVVGGTTYVEGHDLTELTITASKSVGPVDATLAYINADVTPTVGSSESSSTVQAYVTVNF